jgi:FtsP/CotA-like multicopper oxidase with cupredoxin domain
MDRGTSILNRPWIPTLVVLVGGWFLSSVFMMKAASAAESIQPPVCSATTFAAGTAPKDICTVRPLPLDNNGHNVVRIKLTAQTSAIQVGGYSVVTDNYNGTYLTPIVEANPGDTIEAHIVNSLEPRTHDGGPPQSGHDWNPTNLHYFHGGIVTPRNARPQPAQLGDGDNVYVYLRSDKDPHRDPQVPNIFDLKVPIPGDGELDARVLEDENADYISHPLGLNWYHSHLHGISSTQVMGGMSGLLSIGDATANVKAVCTRTDPADPSKCLDDVAQKTNDLKKRTKVYYALLRDLPLKNISKRPDEAGSGTADWDPMNRDFQDGTSCAAWDGTKLSDNPTLRLGFCQRDPKTAWLFTLNGERYPTIRVKQSENLLVRLGNVSSNVAYDLELKNKDDAPPRQLTVLSLDGVVPGRPVSPDQSQTPVQALSLDEILLMPASRVEFYVRNDETRHTKEQHYVLRTKGGPDTNSDAWPEIELAEIVLEPNEMTSPVKVGLNTLMATPPSTLTKLKRAGSRLFEFASESISLPEMPSGCVRDLQPEFNEYRRVTFKDGGETTSHHKTDWSIKTEIIRPTSTLSIEKDQKPDSADADKTTIGFRPFEEYEVGDGIIDWSKPHVCVHIDHAYASINGGHKQLWVLYNDTGTLHNFHIHQMKFRLATRKELEEQYHIDVDNSVGSSCRSQSLYKCFDDIGMTPGEARTAPIMWHDTIPVPSASRVFIVMSFDAKEQIGRYVFHCHILKHEDSGLMAPIEVWGNP